MSQHYDNPDRTSYHFAGIDFGAGADITRVIAVPLSGKSTVAPGVGKRGRVKGATIHNITENFVGSTLDGGVQVGDGSDADKYFDSGRVLDENVDTGESVYLLDDGAQVDIEGGRTTITVTFQVTTGSPTGIADVTLDIDWY